MLSAHKKNLQEKGELYLRIKVFPGAGKNEAREIMADETIKIDISAPPEKGRANQELIKFLAKIFEVEKRNIKIISGKTERLKLLKIKKNG